MKVLKNIFIILTSIGISAMFVLMTVSFSENKKVSANSDSSDFLEFFIPKFEDEKFEKEKISSAQKWDVVYVDIGRLTSIFFLSGDNSLSEGISRSGNVITFDSVKGIFSGYDPFAIYEVENKSRTFNLTQITNWGFYFGENADETVSIYSIDSVSKLTFYFTDKQGERKEATNMILFPGMMIRFDPNKTEILENKDLLSIKNTLAPEWKEYSNILDDDIENNFNSSDKNTWFKFSLTRIKDEKTDQEYWFFVTSNDVSRDVKKLFDNLRKLLNYRAKNVENLKSYSKTDSLGISNSASSEFQNPAKNAFRLLGNLQIIFSKWVNWEISSQEFRDSVTKIITETEKYESNNSAKKLLEQFLIDGRFALFATEWINLTQYQALYNEAANILWIVPTTGKWKLFQSLSNVFSKNLISEKAKTFSESYGWMANSLKDTLNQSGIDDKDYFDIALYAFYILETLRDTQESVGFSRIVVEGNSLHQLYSTILDASQKYANSRPASLHLSTQNTLIIAFYNDMLLKLNATLYSEYTEVDEWYLYVKKWFLNRGLPDFTSNKAMISDIENFYKKISNIYNDKIKASRSNELFEERLAQLEGFLNIINRDTYYIYRENPYKANEKGDKYPPVYDKKTKKLVSKNSKSNSVSVPKNIEKTEKIEENNNQETPKNPDFTNIINSINQILQSNITEKNISPLDIDKNIFKVNMNYQNKNISFNINWNIANNIEILNPEYSVKIEDNLTLNSLKIIVNSFANYEKKIQKIINENKITKIENVSINIGKKYITINNQKFPL